jgi:CRP/FNR family transcriptional regulator
VRDRGFCGALDLDRPSLARSYRSIPARRLIYKGGDITDDVHVIRDGWAACLYRLPDGRHQILAFLIPGDLVSVGALFKEFHTFSVQALTDVAYCMFRRAELQKEMMGNRRVFEKFVEIGFAEKEAADQAVVSLGRRSAPARIAHLILSLMTRLQARGLVGDMKFDLPLRQQHIADAVGLTTVHVSRVINKFRKEGLLDLAHRRVQIANLTGLQRIADEG